MNTRWSEVWICGFWDTRVDKQTRRHTGRNSSQPQQRRKNMTNKITQRTSTFSLTNYRIADRRRRSLQQDSAAATAWYFRSSRPGPVVYTEVMCTDPYRYQARARSARPVHTSAKLISVATYPFCSRIGILVKCQWCNLCSYYRAHIGPCPNCAGESDDVEANIVDGVSEWPVRMDVVVVHALQRRTPDENLITIDSWRSLGGGGAVPGSSMSEFRYLRALAGAWRRSSAHSLTSHGAKVQDV